MTRQINQSMFKLLAIPFTLCISVNAIAQDKIVRKQLITAAIESRIVKKVDVREINLQPGQKTGYHKHPCPVIGYIVSGSVLFQVEGDTVKTLKAGDAFYEPANMPIAHFDNISGTETLKFVANYLLNKETELIQMLPQKSK